MNSIDKIQITALIVARNEEKLKTSAVSRITVERPAKVARVTIYSARPGIIIGRKGSEIDILKKKLLLRNPQSLVIYLVLKNYLEILET